MECAHPAIPEKFTINVKFGDRLSNRLRGGVHRNIIDKLAVLRMSYFDFSPVATWQSVVIEQIWKPATKSWAFDMKWTY